MFTIKHAVYVRHAALRRGPLLVPQPGRVQGEGRAQEQGQGVLPREVAATRRGHAPEQLGTRGGDDGEGQDQAHQVDGLESHPQACALVPHLANDW